MDDNRLRQLWQRFIVSPPADSEEQRQCLTKLLEICIVHFEASASAEKQSVQVSDSMSFKTTRTCIGNWLIHQFIIDLTNVNTVQSPFNTEYDLLKHYFVTGIGWKLLKCIYYFSVNDALLYNFEFIQILVVILKTYLTASECQSVGGQESTTINVIDYFQCNNKLNEQIYLRTVKGDCLSPAKVKSWIKCSCSCMSKANRNKQRLKHSKRNTRNVDSDEDEEEFVIPRHLLKYSLNNSKLYFLAKSSPENPTSAGGGGGAAAGPLSLEELSSLLDTEEDYQLKSPTDIIETINEILIDFIYYEHKTKSFSSIHVPKLSFLVIEKLSSVLNDFLQMASLNLALVRPLKNLLIASSLTISRHASGVELIHKYEVIRSLVRLMEHIHSNIKNCDEEQMQHCYQAEYYDTLSSTISVLTEISHQLLHTEQFHTFQSVMATFFNSKSEQLLSSLAEMCESRLKAKREYDHVYRIVDLLQRLQITWQYSQSLRLHKRICGKKRHNKCDLAPLMAHHFYHLKLFTIDSTTPGMQEQEVPTCISSMVYHVLIKLIFIYSKRNNDSIDKLICHISNHLCFLITCCWSLKRYFKRLLYFALNSNRSNTLRGTIFQIIEFSIKIQRRHHYSSISERCDYCTSEDFYDDGEASEDIKDSVNSEGYLTDNSLVGKSKSSPACLEHRSDSSCLLKSLAFHYITLLKCDNLATRQTVFRHFFNLFSYLSCSSKESILWHILLPVFQGYHDFPSDVCLFTLRLFINISDMATASDELNLLQIFIKVDALPQLKRLILNKYFDVKNDGNCTDRSVLGICLLENLIRKELAWFKANQMVSGQVLRNADLGTLNTIPLLINLFMEQFDICARTTTMQRFENCFLVKSVTLAEYISFYRRTGFNVEEKDSVDLSYLYDSLHCLLKLLTSSNCILADFDFFTSILNHETFGFFEKVYTVFQQLFRMVVNEIKLFRLLLYRESKANFDQSSSPANDQIDTNKYGKFFRKMFKILEQLLSFMLQSLYSKRNIAGFIEQELKEFSEDENLLNWHVYCDVDPVLDLLKMLINIAFNSQEDLKNYLRHEMEDLLNLDVYFSHHPRTSSFDSLISDNDTNNEATEMDHYDCGYEADTEGLLESALLKRKPPVCNVKSKMMPVLKYMDICRVVIDYLSGSFGRKLSLCNNVDFTSLKFEYNSILVVINQITKICKENGENCRLLFENNFTTLIMNGFRSLLTSSNPEDKSIKFALFDLYIEISKVKLRPQELRLLMDLFKQDGADYEFLMSILHKLICSKHWDHSRPRYSVTYPVDIDLSCRPDYGRHWVYQIISRVHDNSDIGQKEQFSFQSVASVLPLYQSKKFKRRYSIAFWIYLDKVNPLIDKFKSFTSFAESEVADLESSKVKNCKLIHLVSMAFSSGTVEMWFDYVYNRFVFRVCKENNGKCIYSNENFIANNGNILGKWNFVRVNVDDLGMSKNRAFIKIAHSINCCKDRIVKLPYYATQFNGNPLHTALLLGSSQNTGQFHYKLGNVFLFSEHLKSTTTIFLYSLGADFSHLHHLQNDCLTKQNYTVLPKLLVRDSSVDIGSSMLQSSSSDAECKFILEHIALLCRASSPKIYFTYGFQDSPSATSSISFAKIYGNQPKKRRYNRIRKAMLFGFIDCASYYGISKTVADSGGISIFVFLFLYLLDRCEDQFVIHKSLELVLRVYDCNYFHRLMFDTHHDGYRVILYALENSPHSQYSPLILRIFSQFSIDYVNTHSAILSTNIEIYISSWKVWIRNLTTMKLFFSSLHSLTAPNNPYRNFNLSQLRKVDTFGKLLYMIEDIYINDSDEVNVLDNESIDQIVAVFKAIINSDTDFHLIEPIFNCLLLLQKNECLHINQTISSFYYLFPSTVLTQMDSHHHRSGVNNGDLVQNSIDSDTGSDSSLRDWEIVSEVVDSAILQSTSQPDMAAISTPKANSDYIVTELLKLIGHVLDQVVEISKIQSLFSNLSCLDFLLIFVNNPSAQVREVALGIFFKFFRMFYSNQPAHTNESAARAAKNKALHLLLVSNQLYSYPATEEIVNICLGFLLDLNRKSTLDLWKQSSGKLLKICLNKVFLDHFIPFLAVLPKCLGSVGFCYKVLQLLGQILDTLAIEQISLLQKDFGLLHSLCKLIINLNTQMSISFEEFNKYTKDQVNERIGQILNRISYRLMTKDEAKFFEQFIVLTDYISILESKVCKEMAIVFRHLQTDILRGAFEAYADVQKQFKANHSRRDHLSLMTDPFMNFINNASILHDMSSETDYDQEEKLTELLHPKDLLQRIKFVMKKSVCFITSRDDVAVSIKEKYFQREVLYHLLDTIVKAENLELRSEARRKEKNIWISTLHTSKDYFKSYLSRILLFLLCPIQQVDDRVFSLHLFAEKSNMLEWIRKFVEKSNDKFYRLFNLFVTDLIELGVSELNIYQLKNYSEEEAVMKSRGGGSSSGETVITAEFVLRRFCEKTNSKSLSGKQSKTEFADWFERVQEEKLAYQEMIQECAMKTFANMSQVYSRVYDTASHYNNQMIIAQQLERKRNFQTLRLLTEMNVKIKAKLVSFVRELIHEKAFWHLPDHYPQSWSLSPFESSNRIRKKMERCFLELDNRYVLNSCSKKLKSDHLFSSFLDVNPSINSSFTPSSVEEKAETGSGSFCFTNCVKVVLYDEEFDGEILLNNTGLQFFMNQSKSIKSKNLFFSKRNLFQNFLVNFVDIQEMTKCRYELQDVAVEIFLVSGLTYLIVFESTGDRDKFVQTLLDNRDWLPNLAESINLVSLTQLWRERRITNFEYLTHLNKLSGRTFNDLMQYPVFPFVIADYRSDILNLKEVSTFRILARPIAVQKKEREEFYIKQYEYLLKDNREREQDGRNSFVVASSPYHYGAHYSNSGIVLYYLVRLPPYTQMFLQYQDKNFDVPDRAFHSIQTTWRLATEDSTNGFKELIPEFFYLPEFLLNTECFNLGIRQNGEQVDDVSLPPWCRNSARLFTLINRQALESNVVTQNLHHWIDLIFGYQQKGKAAVEAINVFHPATHYSADISKIEDEVRRHAIQTMIRTFGQMPSQLFNMPHPAISPDVTLPLEDDLESNLPSMGEVIGLKWGVYVGSPIFPKPIVCLQRKCKSSISKIWALPTNDILLLPINSTLFVSYNQHRNNFINNMYILSNSLCTWSSLDSSIWIRSKDSRSLFTDENLFLDQVVICESIPDYDWLLIGYESGIIVCTQLKHGKNGPENVEITGSKCYFLGHEAKISSITINRNYNIAVSTDVAGVCILWDMNKRQYLRTIKDSDSDPLMLSTISETLGDIAIVQYSYVEECVRSSKLMVYSINGVPIGDISLEPYITSLCYSTAPEGVSINVIATGHSNGSICLWSSWDLTSVRRITITDIQHPIISIAYSFANDLLYVATENNSLLSLENGLSLHLSSNSNSTTTTSNSSSRKNFRLIDLTDMNALREPN